MKNIAIFASGSGTNAENIIQYFSKKKKIKVKLVLSNKKDAQVIEKAEKHGIATRVFDRKTLYETNEILDLLISESIDFIVLAGFLWLLPSYIIYSYPKRVVNIHPALLPKYGGKGMYGLRVHEAVVQNQEKETGITIHYVNEKYDEGNIIQQVRCKVNPNDTPEQVAEKVHQLEYKYYPRVIERLVNALD